ncbi:hypothetical protein BX600DRAFT_507962 [Xylariales sp. PMI_506]|nr:hypothetical protein BX600DRAFT_507962 [Xylariales sp. PMI_506]
MPSDGQTPVSNNDAHSSTGISSDADFAQAFKDLARGEQHAAAMEANLTKLESKLDALLAQFEAAAQASGSDHEESVQQDGPLAEENNNDQKA